jgi:uncharacterized membrane protein YphA (DoxX/SURF4 family)
MNRPAWIKWSIVAMRLILGVVLIAAALPKIRDPYAFSINIREYQMIGEQLGRWMAVVLPWLELVVGALLIAGVWVNAASLISGGMMVMFILAVGSAMARGLDIDCGCFGPEHADPVGWGLILRDCAMLFMCGAVFALTLPKKETEPMSDDIGSTTN